jgi:hypothetical protein
MRLFFFFFSFRRSTRYGLRLTLSSQFDATLLDCSYRALHSACGCGKLCIRLIIHSSLSFRRPQIASARRALTWPEKESLATNLSHVPYSITPSDAPRSCAVPRVHGWTLGLADRSRRACALVTRNCALRRLRRHGCGQASNFGKKMGIRPQSYYPEWQARAPRLVSPYRSPQRIVLFLPPSDRRAVRRRGNLTHICRPPFLGDSRCAHKSATDRIKTCYCGLALQDSIVPFPLSDSTSNGYHTFKLTDKHYGCMQEISGILFPRGGRDI